MFNMDGVVWGFMFSVKKEWFIVFVLVENKFEVVMWKDDVFVEEMVWFFVCYVFEFGEEFFVNFFGVKFFN